MNTKTVKSWLSRNSHFRMCKSLFYILLLLLVVAHLTGAAVKASRLFKFTSASDELNSEVDSFSQSSIAAAILKREIDRVVWTYGESRNEALEFEFERQQHDAINKHQQAAYFHPISASQPDQTSASAPAGLRQIERLRATVQELNTDLDWQLMAIRYTNKEWNEFLDCYLRLLIEAPAKVNALWTRSALECSQECGRTDELVDALQHFLGYHPRLKARPALEATLQEWRTNNLPNLGAQ